MRRLLLALLLALLAPAHAADCPAPIAPLPFALGTSDRGLLWRIERDGTTSYLYGSMHLGRPAWSQPGPALRKAWAATTVLAVELDMTDPKTQAAFMSTPPPARPLDAALLDRLRAQTLAACVPAAAMAAMHPMLQLTTLIMLSARRDGMDAMFGQEVLLLGLAKASQRPVVALETMEEQMRVLIPADPDELERMMAEGLSQLEKNQVRGPMLELALAWERGDLAHIGAYERWCDCVHNEADRLMLRRLNDDRNPALAERIVALHTQGKPVFAAVGALHMSGPKALPLLLKGLGFRVERVVY